MNGKEESRASMVEIVNSQRLSAEDVMSNETGGTLAQPALQAVGEGKVE